MQKHQLHSKEQEKKALQSQLEALINSSDEITQKSKLLEEEVIRKQVA